MNDRIPAQLIETVDASTPIRLTPAQSGGPIHTRSFSGYFRNLRLLGGGLLMLLYFGTVWLNWDGRQAVLWDLGQQQFHIFGATFWPQDFILLSALLIIAAFGLFFITVLAGRVWCGYACPQSSWTWMFMWAEKVTEGDRLQRIKLDAAPWSPGKLLRRSAKHALWLAISLATALTFVGYFTPVRELVGDLTRLDIGLTSAFWLLFFTAATYLNAGWLREQVCLHMCPYSRFQSVMFDADTLLVSYDAARGEARGARRKDSDPRAQNLGDCIDCTLCVQVCPTGGRHPRPHAVPREHAGADREHVSPQADQQDAAAAPLCTDADGWSVRPARPERSQPGTGRDRRSAGQRRAARRHARIQPRTALRGPRPGRAGQPGAHAEHLRRSPRRAAPVDWPLYPPPPGPR